jgi:glycosyltransferase involved in cell wall biosynthesis
VRIDPRRPQYDPDYEGQRLVTSLLPIRSAVVRVMCYNEEASICEVVHRLLQAADAHPYDLWVEVIDDGSVDQSVARLHATFGSAKRVSVLRHTRNLGIGAMLREAFRPCDKDAVVLLCGDLQFAPEDVFRLLQELEGADLVTALRMQRQDNIWRLLITWIDRSLTRLLFGRSFPDVHWVRAVRASHLATLRFITHSPMVDLELALAIQSTGSTYATVALPHYPRTRGKASGAKWTVIVKSFTDLLRVAAAHHGRQRYGGRHLKRESDR